MCKTDAARTVEVAVTAEQIRIKIPHGNVWIGRTHPAVKLISSIYALLSLRVSRKLFP